MDEIVIRLSPAEAEKLWDFVYDYEDPRPGMGHKSAEALELAEKIRRQIDEQKENHNG